MRRLLAALALLGSVCGRSVPGVVELDEFTFEKVAASAHFDVLVKFDKEYAYGTSEDTFKAVVATLNAAETRSDFLVASLAIKECAAPPPRGRRPAPRASGGTTSRRARRSRPSTLSTRRTCRSSS
mmetsp:Transcript_2142/g.7833  ORF Transcript_2142/g.7833 Transcript_2142/m.7833 type:complete len:126 (-) Transcript_2142:383-760(-)